MQFEIDRIIEVYGLMVSLGPDQEAETRKRLAIHLRDCDASGQALDVEGLKFLRNGPVKQQRRSVEQQSTA